MIPTIDNSCNIIWYKKIAYLGPDWYQKRFLPRADPSDPEYVGRYHCTDNRRTTMPINACVKISAQRPSVYTRRVNSDDVRTTTALCMRTIIAARHAFTRKIWRHGDCNDKTKIVYALIYRQLRDNVKIRRCSLHHPDVQNYVLTTGTASSSPTTRIQKNFHTMRAYL